MLSYLNIEVHWFDYLFYRLNFFLTKSKDHNSVGITYG